MEKYIFIIVFSISIIFAIYGIVSGIKNINELKEIRYLIEKNIGRFMLSESLPNFALPKYKKYIIANENLVKSEIYADSFELDGNIAKFYIGKELVGQFNKILSVRRA